MATISLKAYETAVTVLSGAASGELVSLAHGSLSAVSDGTHGLILDNTAVNTEDLYADFELNVGTLGGNALVGGRFLLYMYGSMDGGTTYAQSPGAGTMDPNLMDPVHLVGTFVVPSGMTTTGRLHIYRYPLLPGKMRFQLLNLCGQALPATGSGVSALRYNLSSV